MTMGEIRDRKPDLYGVRGWLAFLCVTLLIFTPLGLLIEMAQMLIGTSRTAMTPDILIGIAFGVAITAFAVYAGLGLVRMWRNAVRAAKWFFFISAGLGALPLAGVMFEVEASPTELMAAVRWFFGSIAWLLYLYRSERVRNTYGGDTIRDAADVFR